MGELIALGAPWLHIATALLVLTSLGGVAGVAVLVNNRLTRGKMRADTTLTESQAEETDAKAAHAQAQAVSLIMTAAQTVLGPLERRVNDQDGQITQLRLELDSVRTEMHANDRLIAEHAGWDYIVEQRLQDAGIEYPDRPPLRLGATEAAEPVSAGR